MGGNSYAHPFLVAEINYDGLLGFDFLKSHRCTVDVHSSVLRLPPESNVCGEGPNYPETRVDLETRKVKVRVVEDVLVQPGHEMILPVQPEESSRQSMIVEPISTFVQKHNLMVCKVIIDGTSERSPLRVMNLGSESKLIRKGTVAAEAEPIVDVWNAETAKLKREPDLVASVASTSADIPISPHLGPMIKGCRNKLSVDQLTEVKKLLSEYDDVFSKSNTDIGKTGVVKHRIETGNQNPIKQSLRRAPMHL
ncbi:uncharacterized protein LOC132564840 [Ylistrum balloti]|uniref:uncharacterized protein LOC132564840 n=1 Tax=Ylistrum balloti TaxID=509963 RepID=UPI0029059291|nr:uncharacterized protein LOC132564840 [Ylistrum balloti]